MKNKKNIEDVITEGISEINLLLPKNKKIKKNNFKIHGNPSFDSLNYVTFILSIEKRLKAKLKKNIDLINSNVEFKNKEQLIKYILKNL